MSPVASIHPLDLYPALDAQPGASLLLLTSHSCGHCRAMRAALQALPALPFPLKVFEVDAGANRGVVEEHAAFHLPSLHLYTDGDYHGAVEAPPVPGALAAAIQAVHAAPRQDLPG